SGSTSRKISPCFLSSSAMTLASKPIEPGRLRAEMIFSRSVKAPPHTNRMLVVSTCRNSCCGQLENDVLDVLADIASFRERRRIGDRERNIENARQRLRQQCLARAGWADQEDIRFR